MNDAYVESLQDERRTPVWVAELSSGAVIYQDDDRPGAVPASGWARLRERLLVSKEKIARLHLKFRSNWVYDVVPPGMRAYFFGKRLDMMFGGGQEASHFYILGFAEKYILTGNPESIRVKTSVWQTPSLTLFESGEEREVALGDTRLIVNGKS